MPQDYAESTMAICRTPTWNVPSHHRIVDGHRHGAHCMAFKVMSWLDLSQRRTRLGLMGGVAAQALEFRVPVQPDESCARNTPTQTIMEAIAILWTIAAIVPWTAIIQDPTNISLSRQTPKPTRGLQNEMANWIFGSKEGTMGRSDHNSCRLFF